MFKHSLTLYVAKMDASEIKLPTKILASQAKTNCLVIRPQKLNDNGIPEPFYWARATLFTFIPQPKPFVDRSSHCTYNSTQYIRGKFCSQLAWDRLDRCVLGNTQSAYPRPVCSPMIDNLTFHHHIGMSCRVHTIGIQYSRILTILDFRTYNIANSNFYFFVRYLWNVEVMSCAVLWNSS